MNRYVAVGLIAPLLWSLAVFVDKSLLAHVKYPARAEKYVIPMLMIVSAAVNVPVAILVLCGRAGDVWVLTGRQMLVLVGSGVVKCLGVQCYLRAMDKDSPTNVVPLFQLIPFFALVFGVRWLNETVSVANVWGGILLVLGSILLVLDLRTFRVKWIVLLWMIGACLCMTLGDLWFREIYKETTFMASVFGNAVGRIIVGTLFAIVPAHRSSLVQTVRANGRAIVVRNVINELLSKSGTLVFFFVGPYLLFYYLQLLNTVQPLFILLISGILAMTHPRHFRAYWDPAALPRQVLAIALMIGGVLLVV